MHLLLDLEDLPMSFAGPVVAFEVLLMGVAGALLGARTDFEDLRIDSEVRLLDFEYLLANSEYLRWTSRICRRASRILAMEPEHLDQPLAAPRERRNAPRTARSCC